MSLDPHLVLFVEDLAQRYRCSAKAVRGRVGSGALPTPMRLGRRLAWLSEDVFAFEVERSRAARQAEAVRVTITTYKYKGLEGLQAIWQMQSPCSTKELKTTAIVPDHIRDRDAAKAWAMAQIGVVLPKLLQKAGIQKEEPQKIQEQKIQEQKVYKLGEFIETRYIPEKVRGCKKSSQDTMVRILRQHVIPTWGSHRLDTIDENLIALHQGKMVGKPGTVNMRLKLLRAALRYAKKLKLISSIPEISFRPDKRKALQVFSEEEIKIILEAAEEESPTHHLIFLLLLDLGLRAGEACALKWEDINFDEGTVTIQRTLYEGEETTPKGIIATLELTAALTAALLRTKAKDLGPFVLYRDANWRKQKRTEPRWVSFTGSALRWRINTIQRAVKLKVTGAHFMRHTSITSFARLGLEAVELQAHARHAKLSTTQEYIHLAGRSRSKSTVGKRDAARAAQGDSPKTSKSESKKPKRPQDAPNAPL